MPQIPSIEDLIAFYPFGEPAMVATLVGGTVGKKVLDPKIPTYKDTCTIRVSRSLNYAGDPIPDSAASMDNPGMPPKNKVRIDKGGDEKNYIYSTYDVRAYLATRYGRANIHSGGNRKPGSIDGISGIILFFPLHIDLWNGLRCAGHDRFGDNRVKEIYFWKTHSFVDEWMQASQRP